MKLRVQVGPPGDFRLVELTHPDSNESTVLDILLYASEHEHPELAYRYGCRAERCGLCTVDLDGKPRLACQARARDGQTVRPLQGQPVVRDLVTDRHREDALLRGRLPSPGLPAGGESAAPGQIPAPSEAWRSLERCVTCYACLTHCPLHAAGGGNPMALLRIERCRTDPASTEQVGRQAMALALDLGLAACADCRGCRCGVGIRLVRDVIDPLLAAAGVAGAGGIEQAGGGQ